MAFIHYPDGDDAGNDVDSWTLNGSGVTSPWQALNNYDDTKYITRGGQVTVRAAMTLAGTNDETDPTQLWINFRARRTATGVLGAGSFLQLTVFADDSGKFLRPANFDLATLTTSFADYSLQAGSWTAFGSNNGTIWLTMATQAGTTTAIEISHLSFSQGAPEVSSADYPQAGAASVTMSGSSTQERGKPVNPQLNSYFFLPAGATVGITDDGNFYQGWGTDPMPDDKKKRKNE